jgi:hypothetical protein
MSSIAGTRRGTRAVAALALVASALVAVGGVAAAGSTVSAVADTTQQAPYSFD